MSKRDAKNMDILVETIISSFRSLERNKNKFVCVNYWAFTCDPL